MMEILETFSTKYANGVTALMAVCTLLLAVLTLWYLKREFTKKFRPYVIPVVQVEPIHNQEGCIVSIAPTNVGSHPCIAKFKEIFLHIGDESHSTPETKEWILLAPHGVGVLIPAGHVNETGVTKIKEGRYKKNRIELSFIMCTCSTEREFEKSESFSYEINVLGERPMALFRPEWKANA